MQVRPPTIEQPRARGSDGNTTHYPRVTPHKYQQRGINNPKARRPQQTTGPQCKSPPPVELPRARRSDGI
eukprot:5989880-Karenia_brevis.AAC.1